MLPARLYPTPLAGLDAFLEFSSAAQARVAARPEWLEWLRAPATLDPQAPHGAGSWKKELSALAPNPINALRLLRQREYLRLGLLDFTGIADVEEIIAELSALADFCLQTVLDSALAQQRERSGDPGSAFAIISMGKLGGQELNYSSDIDVMFVYGEEGEVHPGLSRHEYFARLARRLCAVFSEPAEEGALFRIDLRLRPEGDTGPLARSLASYENYYAAYGETWERMALIKARPCAGDPVLGYEFEQLRNHFSYPRGLSPQVLEEIAGIKLRIEKEMAGPKNAASHVKLGPGGIRDIEFIAQALQLLHGARQPYLQSRGTLAALRALRELELLTVAESKELNAAYRWWRQVEHRLQMVADLQTHLLPQDAAQRGKIAASLGMELAAFDERNAATRSAVRRVYERIFAPTAQTAVSFPLEIFTRPESAQRQLEALTPGANAAVQPSARNRESFRRLASQLEKALRGCVDPDTALVRFVRFVEAYGARGLLYETFANSARALELLVSVFDSSEYFSGLLVARPDVFEDQARRGNLDAEKSREQYVRELRQRPGDPAMESRRFKDEEMVRLLMRDVLGLADLRALQQEFTALAEACLQVLLEKQAGSKPLVIVGLGAFGGGELGFGADLDCLFIGDDAEAGARLAHAVTAPQESGPLYTMDLRLRPNAEGPLCQPLESYTDYYVRHAQFWEIQALTRARIAVGNAELGRRYMDAALQAWRERCSTQNVMREIRQMRERMWQERVGAEKDARDFKVGRGGLADVEFGLQVFLMQKQVHEPNTWRALDLLEKENPQLAGNWRGNSFFLRHLQSVLRRDRNSPVSVLPDDAADLGRLARRTGFGDAAAFMRHYEAARARIREGFTALVG
jgi:glutamate-ammonia-ligase adenylyltransferase